MHETSRADAYARSAARLARPARLETTLRRLTAQQRPRLYLVRHGETDWNAQGRLLSRTDEPLNAIGEQQAIVLSGELAEVGSPPVVFVCLGLPPDR